MMHTVGALLISQGSWLRRTRHHDHLSGYHQRHPNPPCDAVRLKGRCTDAASTWWGSNTLRADLAAVTPTDAATGSAGEASRTDSPSPRISRRRRVAIC